MRCDEFENRWQALLDERDSPELDHALRQHASECPECGDVLRMQALLFSEMGRGKEIDRGRGESVHILRRERVDGDSTVRKTSAGDSGTRTWMGWAVAASLLFLVVRGGLVGNGSVSLTQVPSPLLDVPRPMAYPPRELVSGQTPGGTLAASPAEQEAVRKLMEGLAATFSEDPEEPYAPLDRIAGGVRPFTNSLNAAWGALLRSIPEDGEEMVNEPSEIWSWLSLSDSAA